MADRSDRRHEPCAEGFYIWLNHYFTAGHFGVLPFLWGKKGQDKMREEKYRIKCPKYILFGDPYMKDLMFKGQDMEEKGIGVDTAQYLIEVDGRYEEINTGGDSWWGRNLEFTHRIGAKRALDASVVTIWMPEDETFEGMKKLAGYLFEDLSPLKK